MAYVFGPTCTFVALSMFNLLFVYCVNPALGCMLQYQIIALLLQFQIVSFKKAKKNQKTQTEAMSRRIANKPQTTIRYGKKRKKG